MKKSLITLAFILAFAFGSLLPAVAQEQPEPQKDSVNMDTNAKPETYYEVEDDKAEAGGSKSSAGLVIGIVCAVLVIGGVVYFIGKKKKK